jgi:hypothetical protein
MALSTEWRTDEADVRAALYAPSPEVPAMTYERIRYLADQGYEVRDQAEILVEAREAARSDVREARLARIA